MNTLTSNLAGLIYKPVQVSASPDLYPYTFWRFYWLIHTYDATLLLNTEKERPFGRKSKGT